MAKSKSPLRYPGGKASLLPIVSAIISENGLADGIYVEPFAGGAGVALGLLDEERVDRVLINDFDRKIFCFWHSVLNRTDALKKRIETVELSIPEWRRQKAIYQSPGRRSFLDIGFSAFYLNRCNRSGIMVNGGPIGGYAQDGDWKIDARFNRERLVQQIDDIASYGDRIVLSNLDASNLLGNLKTLTNSQKGLVYADPPYYVKGSKLYWRFYQHSDHVELADALKKHTDHSWILTYDDVPEIRSMYPGNTTIPFYLNYSASKPKTGREILVLGPELASASLSDWDKRSDLDSGVAV